ncbi:MAG TPA: hypothetical protein VD886_17950 [Herpetosiphonaceae bacterium]|nr:hypothetical protein [Herpetosiphonaceae bacterium]
MDRLKTIAALIALVGVLIAGVPARTAAAATYEVGPGRAYARLSQVAGLLNPGDVVLVYGNGATPYDDAVIFTRPGTAASKITIRGVRVNGRRPILTTASAVGVEFRASHYVFEGFEATGTADNHRVLYHHADDILVRDTLIRDCPRHGVLGANSDSGSLTLDHVEITNCGNGVYEHAIYMATGLPGAVFRMQHCYLHGQKGGNAVKSRANRNEIYYNWIEGAFYHELELIGPANSGLDSPREDSDVVGNVLIKRQDFPSVARIGGDGTGQSWGRYRFVNNTIVVRDAGATAIRLFDGLESVEFHNNVFTSAAGGGVNLIRTVEAEWRNGRVIAGSNNWIQNGSTIPAELRGTVQGADPQFANFAANNLRPAAGSPLIGAASASPAGPAGHDFPAPLTLPREHPPLRAVAPLNVVELRPLDAALDIGAYEVGTPPVLDRAIFVPGLWR